eukprot:TRINITY_DN3802_c0_g1_i8.p1 TRINITY_DN3802_c0_g1~~TRINITY_DN3802_c0_g1_i8.p1  ORF type:complete len:294 (-),score=44.52 TRINITY_DN3802_c0_g1_i8:25-906(-)
MKENPKFVKFVKSRAEVPSLRGLDLSSYLIKPVQRLCKYPLLLKELLKYTSETDSDYAALTAAREKINQVAGYVNDKTRDFASRTQVLDLQNLIDEGENLKLVQPTRRLVRQALVSECVPEVSRSKWHTRHYILFNDLLLITRPKKHSKFQYEFIAKLPLDSIRVCGVLVGGASPSESLVGLEIVHTRDYHATIAIFADGDTVCTEWLEAIQHCIAEQAEGDVMHRSRSRSGNMSVTLHDLLELEAHPQGADHSARGRSALRTVTGITAPASVLSSQGQRGRSPSKRKSVFVF